MKVLIDENLPRKLANYLTGHECRTVAECGWAGKKNGQLLLLAESLFDVLVTLDKSVPYQQDVTSRRIAILVVRARSSRIQDLLPRIPDCLVALERIRPGEVVRIAGIQPCRERGICK
jgi:hypothetical protein